MKSRLRVLILAAAAAASFSGNASAAEQWVNSLVRTVYPLGNGSFVVTFFDSSSACTNINNPKYMYVGVGENGVTMDGAKAMLATVLTAFVAGKRIQAAFDDSTSSCYVNRLLIID